MIAGEASQADIGFVLNFVNTKVDLFAFALCNLQQLMKDVSPKISIPGGDALDSLGNTSFCGCRDMVDGFQTSPHVRTENRRSEDKWSSICRCNAIQANHWHQCVE